jgi:hypothetical protein
MSHPRFEVVPSAPAVQVPVRPRRSVLGAAIMVLGVVTAGAVTYASKLSFDRGLEDLDRVTLETAGALLSSTIASEQRLLESSARALSDDARIRVTLATPDIDRATIEDVLADLRQASEAALVAILTPTGAVRALTGHEALKDLDMSSSAVVKRAGTSASASGVWTFPDRLVIVALAPIRAGNELDGFLLIGNDLSQETLGQVASQLGVIGALVVHERVVRSAPVGTPEALLETAVSMETDRLIRIPFAQPYVARTTRLDPNPAGAKVTWFTPLYSRRGAFGLLSILIFAPVALVTIVAGALALRKG